MWPNDWIFKVHPCFNGSTATLVRWLRSVFYKVQWQHFLVVVDRSKILCVNFFTDSVHHKSFVWLIFDFSYSKNTRWKVFGTQCISPVCVESLIVCMYADSEVCCSGQRTLLILHCDTTTTTTSTVTTMG